ncbi:hypothetical protein LJR225_005002 [Phenylobacterium sp. LjRoot225]|uniref:hypothetical protein n=1 Tax=Phenylobacterium sp. LjRoot225 TaxID=3342285 RepID=UPI003ECFA218
MIGGSQTQASDRQNAQTLRQRLLAGALALAGHALVLVVVLSVSSPIPPAPEPPPFESALVELVPAPLVMPSPEPAPAAPASRPAGPKTPAPPKPAAAKPPPARVLRQVAVSEVPPRLVPPSPPEPPREVAVSAVALASALTAEAEAAGAGGMGGTFGDGAGGGGDGGGGGGRCDMVRRLQQALRNDASVQAAVARAPRAPGFAGRPLVVWNGDWVRHGDEEGKGLASVRQAIAVEVAFAPRPCRVQAMRGLVLLSLTDAPGAPRLVLGAGAWRWSDLTLAR